MLTGKLPFKSINLKHVAVTAIIVVFTAILSIVIFSPHFPQNIKLAVGETAKENVVSPQDIEFESLTDREYNNVLIEQTKTTIGKVYSIDKSITKEILENVNHFFQSLRNDSRDSLGLDIKHILKVNELSLLRQLDDNAYTDFKNKVLDVTRQYVQSGVKEVNTQRLSAHIKETLLNFDNTMQTISLKVLSHYIEPNFIIDDVQTDLLFKQAIRDLDLKKTTLKQGQVIVFKGSVAEEKHIEAFKALSMYNLQVNSIKFFGIVIITFMTFILLERFIRLFNPSIYTVKHFFLIMLTIALVIVMARFTMTLSFLPDDSMNFLLIPISISSMLISFLITSNISLLTGSLLSILIAIMFQNSFEALLFLFFSNAVTTFSIHRTFKRSELILAGYIVGLFNIFFVIALGLLKEQTDWLWYSFNMLAAFGNGVVASMISLAILPYFESLFKITTSQTLLELSNLNHPLLKKLMLNAPGTYQHSLMVASLSEAAAEAVRANPVLCRVGSYFHDIGKLKRPVFFAENQFSSENPHNNLAPRMSKMIILSHVKDGYEMAEKHKLPQIIQDIILQHHGTSLLSFFYQKENIETGETLDSDNEFRYLGPKPQTKEAGIVMLADSVEATLRSVTKPTPQKIEGIINKIFKDKLDDDQLNECPLSFDDIDKIKNTFLSFFRGVHHSRLDYQDEVDKLNSNDGSSTSKKDDKNPAQ